MAGWGHASMDGHKSFYTASPGVGCADDPNDADSPKLCPAELKPEGQAMRGPCGCAALGKVRLGAQGRGK